jgi:hypothetical protein
MYQVRFEELRVRSDSGVLSTLLGAMGCKGDRKAQVIYLRRVWKLTLHRILLFFPPDILRRDIYEDYCITTGDSFHFLSYHFHVDRLCGLVVRVRFPTRYHIL